MQTKANKAIQKTGREQWSKNDWALHHASVETGKKPFEDEGSAPTT